MLAFLLAFAYFPVTLFAILPLPGGLWIFSTPGRTSYGWV